MSGPAGMLVRAPVDASPDGRLSLLIVPSRTVVSDQRPICLARANVGLGSQPEVSDGHENVGYRGKSGSRFRATGGLLVAKGDLSAERNPRSISALSTRL